MARAPGVPSQPTCRWSSRKRDRPGEATVLPNCFSGAAEMAQRNDQLGHGTHFSIQKRSEHEMTATDKIHLTQIRQHNLRGSGMKASHLPTIPSKRLSSP
jgi:hypothetical protein